MAESKQQERDVLALDIEKSIFYVQGLIHDCERIFGDTYPLLQKVLSHLEYAKTLTRPTTGDMIVNLPIEQYKQLLKQSEMLEVILQSYADANKITMIEKFNK